MVPIRRVISTPTCRRAVKIDARDFLLPEHELAQKYGVPWFRWDDSRNFLWALAAFSTACLVAALRA
jgi:hypothetical protein